jgi:hypothetical protein
MTEPLRTSTKLYDWPGVIPRRLPDGTMGLQGLVSTRRDRPYQADRSKHWVKVKSRTHPAMSRVLEALC